MQIQNISEPEFFINSASTTLKLLYFRCILVRLTEHSVKFLQMNDLLQVLQVTLADIKRCTYKKRRKLEIKMMKVCDE